MIGFCGIKYEKEHECPDIGFRMMPTYWGQGLATEAVKATLEYARDVLGIEQIVGEVVDVNIASTKILLELGFKHVGSYEKDGFNINRYEWESLS